MMLRLCLLFTFFAFPVLAQEETLYSKTYGSCMEKAGGVTADMLECIAAEFAEQDKRLNRAYKAVVDTLTKARKAALQNAQRKWIAFRDANCNFYYDPDGGSLARLQANECIVRMTAERARELDSMK